MERRFCKPKAVGSIPTPGTIFGDIMEDLTVFAGIVAIVVLLFGCIGTLAYAGTQQRLLCIDKVKHLPASEIVMVCGK